jgi:hypothetical protein
MATETTYELAYRDTCGDWQLIGDYPTEEAAIEAARVWATGDVVHHDHSGTAVFGISGDPDSGHYETQVEVFEDGDFLVS